MFSLLFSAMSPAGAHARLSVLIFHRVLAQPDPLFPGEVDAQQFDRICGWLGAWGKVLPLADAVCRLGEGTLPAGAMAITFDDGYADNLEVATPILQRYGLHATFFIATGFLDGGRMWNDTVIEAVRGAVGPALDLRDEFGADFPVRPLNSAAARRDLIEAILPRIKYLAPAARDETVARIAGRSGATLPGTLMMRSDQVRALHRTGMGIGAHTRTHPILAGLPAAQARDEIAGGRRALEELLDEPVRLFAYPNGKPERDFSDESVAIVRELGFEAAVTTAWGAAASTTDPLRLPRFTPWDRSRTRFGVRLLNNLRTATA